MTTSTRGAAPGGLKANSFLTSEKATPGRATSSMRCCCSAM
jgi:hypothetical protein